MIEVTHHERCVLGGMLENEANLKDGLALLTADHFSLDSHRRVYRAVAGLDASGVPVSPMTVIDALRGRKELDSVGGAGWVVDLPTGLPRNFDVDHSARMVREASALRSLATNGERLMTAALAGDESSAVLVERMRENLAILVEDNSRDEMVTMEALVPSTIGRILSPETRQPPIPTGIYKLDSMTMGGIRPKELWICGSLPSRGKTSLARQVARNAARAGTPVAVFSIEMANEEWNELDIAVEAGVPPWKLRSRAKLSKEESDSIIRTGDRLLTWPMRYEDSGKLHIRTLLAKARLSVMKCGTRLVVVDYIQRVKSDDREIRNRVGNVAEALAEFAKDNDCAVMALSQLARRGDINSRPTMQDLKESGDLEAHAHTVLLNFRPVEKKDEETIETFTGQDEIIIGKQRFGPIGTVPVYYNSDTLTFQAR